MTRKPLRGIELRYALTLILLDEGPMAVADLSFELNRQGFEAAGRPSKTISDALRWEIRLHRVLPRGRNLYGIGDIPRSTEHRMRRRVEHLRLQAELSTDLGQDDDPDDQFDRFFDTYRESD